tara:strand:- start:191 stop:706 length:516 start_codon:yes stop_codon:yes gene_type:complete
MMLYKFYKILIYLVVSIYFANPVFAETKLLGTEKYWKAYSTKLDKTKTCFITSEPIKSEGKFNKKNRGKPYVFVTNIKNGTNHEVSIKAGFNFKKNNEVVFDVDGKKTKLFPVDDRAWSESSKTDRLLVQSMRKGKKLKITGTSTPGNTIIDTYSLSGFTKALRLIDKSCS